MTVKIVIYHYDGIMRLKICGCQSICIDRTERRPYVRLQEHIPKRLSSKWIKAFSSAILKHLCDTRNRIGRLKSFRIIN